MEGQLIADVAVGTPDELVAILESRFLPEVEFELPAAERRVQLAETLARQLQDRLMATAADAGWDVFALKASVVKRLTDRQRIFTDPAIWRMCEVPLVLVRPTTRETYPTPDGFGAVVMLNCSTAWRLLGSLSLADPSWLRAFRFDSSSALREE